jgi:hypothetical protein
MVGAERRDPSPEPLVRGVLALVSDPTASRGKGQGQRRLNARSPGQSTTCRWDDEGAAQLPMRACAG